MPDLLPAPVVFFTGAGVSVGSGLPTYRGTGGIYESGSLRPPDASDVTDDRLPELWERFRPRLRAFDDLAPAAAHRAIAAVESALPPGAVTVVTQNVDGLHARAGSRRVIELHGNLRIARCRVDGAQFHIKDVPWADGDAPRCPNCASIVRPGVVLFGEQLPAAAFAEAKTALAQARTVIAVGTSAQVYPAAFLISTEQLSATVLLWVNPETAPPTHAWTWLRGSADSELTELLRSVTGLPAYP